MFSFLILNIRREMKPSRFLYNFKTILSYFLFWIMPFGRKMSPCLFLFNVSEFSAEERGQETCSSEETSNARISICSLQNIQDALAKVKPKIIFNIIQAMSLERLHIVPETRCFQNEILA